MVKRYFNVNTKTTRLPFEFTQAKGPRFIHFIHCRLEYQNQLVGNASVHGNWIVRMPTLDGFVSWCNVDITKRFKWEITHDMNTLEVWFKENATGGNLNIPDGSFVLQLMLEF